MRVLDITDLHKHYREHRALDGAQLQVEAGEVCGLLGPNGAGKTTLMKAVLGLQRPTSGSIQISGRPAGREQLAQVGALIETPGLWPHLDAATHLEIHAALRGVPVGWGQEVLKVMDLTEVRRRPVKAYSLGMRWRLGIAIALLARPRLLLLDEPTNGLDPIGVRQMRSVIRALADTEVAVLVSSHQLSEIAQMCDRVAVLISGRTHYQGPLDGLAVDGSLEAGFFRLVDEVGAGVR